jgi:hypothetical protein
VTVGRKRDQVKPNRKKRVNLRVSSLPCNSADEVRKMRGKPCGAWLSGRFRARIRPLAFDRTGDGYPSVTRITHCYAFIAVRPAPAVRRPDGDATHRIVTPGLRIGEATPTSWCRIHAEARAGPTAR